MKFCSNACHYVNDELKEWLVELLEVGVDELIRTGDMKKFQRIHRVLCGRVKKFGT